MSESLWFVGHLTDGQYDVHLKAANRTQKVVTVSWNANLPLNTPIPDQPMSGIATLQPGEENVILRGWTINPAKLTRSDQSLLLSLTIEADASFHNDDLTWGESDTKTLEQLLAEDH